MKLEVNETQPPTSYTIPSNYTEETANYIKKKPINVARENLVALTSKKWENNKSKKDQLIVDTSLSSNETTIKNIVEELMIDPIILSEKLKDSEHILSSNSHLTKQYKTKWEDLNTLLLDKINPIYDI
ncbi:hypothetical protein CDIK_0087 [Cucumispora dikerogammari]|nr:hypothetical protein CDIK_0087 [Cucumispora dikerogammari]